MSARTRIAIIGPGAIGGYVAACLQRLDRHDVTVCARAPVPELVIDSSEGVPSFRVTPSVVTDPSANRPVDWVFVATKAYDVEPTARWFPGLIGPNTTIAVLQNGVEHVERFAPHVAVEKIMPVVVWITGERQVRTRILQRGVPRLTAPDSEQGRRFGALFTDTPIAITLTPDIRTAAWRKLCGNSPGVINALLLQPTGVMHDKKIGELIQEMVRECIAVGRAEGAVLGDDVVDAVLEGYRNAAPGSVNSMHADRAAGRTMEIDARNEVVVRLGRKHGIPTPCNAMAVALLEAMVRTGDAGA